MSGFFMSSYYVLTVTVLKEQKTRSVKDQNNDENSRYTPYFKRS